MNPEVPATPDEEILRLFQETGSPRYFAELFLRQRKRIYFACLGFFSNGAAAEDATQETFLRVYANPSGFHGGDVSAWLLRIARNVCIDQWRKGRAETEIDSVAGQLAREEPHAALEARLMADRIRQEMQSLAPEQRRCLEMKIEGYSYDETARSTGLSVEAVKSHLQNGRRMLWRRMEGALSKSR